jgi:RNA polymerase sigma factor (sigma-70 family)
LNSTKKSPEFNDEIIDIVTKISSKYRTIDDSLSIAFVGLFERFKNYDASRASFKTWVTLTTHYVLLDEIRKRKRQQQKMPSVSIDNLNFDFLTGNTDIEHALLRKERNKALRDTIAKLKYRDRLFVYFVFLKENTQRDLAKILKRTEGCMAICKKEILIKLRNLFLFQKNL